MSKELESRKFNKSAISEIRKFNYPFINTINQSDVNELKLIVNEIENKSKSFLAYLEYMENQLNS